MMHPFLKFMADHSQSEVAARLDVPQTTVSYQYRMCKKNPLHKIPSYYAKVIAQMSNNKITRKVLEPFLRDIDIRGSH